MKCPMLPVEWEFLVPKAVEKIVKAIKGKPGVKNPFAIAYSIVNKKKGKGKGK